MKFRDVVPEGARILWYHGIGWTEFERYARITFMVPFHWPARWIRDGWFHFQVPESRRVTGWDSEKMDMFLSERKWRRRVDELEEQRKVDANYINLLEVRLRSNG